MSSTLSFLFSPSSFILFGDSHREPKNSLDLALKYDKYNLNQSMFKRLFDANNCVLHLKYTYRFPPTILQMLNYLFYGGSLELKFSCPNSIFLKDIALFHHENSDSMLKLITQMTNFKPKYQFVILADDDHKVTLTNSLGYVHIF